jgi:hypothetical protein
MPQLLRAVRTRLLAGTVLLSALAAATAATLVTTTAGQAASPQGGTVDATTTSTSWSGGPFAAINPTVDTDCAVEQAPFCDTFELTVGTLSTTHADVVVSVSADDSQDILSVDVYDSDGNVVASSSTFASTQNVTMLAPAPGTYDVRTELALGTPGVSTYRATATATDADAPIDLEQDCFVEDQSVVFDLDTGQWVDLDVLVLLDGVDESYARSFFTHVARAYEGLKVRVVPTFQVADPPFVGDSSADIIDQARRRFPQGKVPAEYDIVEVLTSKDIQALGQYAVAGQADCLGGLAYDERSYEVSEANFGDFPQEGIAIGPATYGAYFAAKITAHEMGHLLGGQHHYANCVEGNDPDEELDGDTSPCTLMFNSADLVSLQFGTVNGRIARGYAFRYARGNDTPSVAPKGKGFGSKERYCNRQQASRDARCRSNG